MKGFFEKTEIPNYKPSCSPDIMHVYLDISCDYVFCIGGYFPSTDGVFVISNIASCAVKNKREFILDYVHKCRNNDSFIKIILHLENNIGLESKHIMQYFQNFNNIEFDEYRKEYKQQKKSYDTLKNWLNSGNLCHKHLDPKALTLLINTLIKTKMCISSDPTYEKDEDSNVGVLDISLIDGLAHIISSNSE